MTGKNKKTTKTKVPKYTKWLKKGTLKKLYTGMGFSIREICFMCGLGYSKVRDSIIYHDVRKRAKVSV
jgi:hypothetical protein